MPSRLDGPPPRHVVRRSGDRRWRRALFPALDRWVSRPRRLEGHGTARGRGRFRQRAAAVGLRATGHSLRVRAAVSMASRGASLVAMQQAGGWAAPTCPPTTDARPAPARGRSPPSVRMIGGLDARSAGNPRRGVSGGCASGFDAGGDRNGRRPGHHRPLERRNPQNGTNGDNRGRSPLTRQVV